MAPRPRSHHRLTLYARACCTVCSAVLIGSCLAPGSKLVSIEMNPVYADIARRIIEHAGLAGRVEVWVGDVPAVLPKVVGTFGSGSVDLVLIDHWKDVSI